MALFPTQAFTKDNVKARWRERYTSESMNKKFLGIPKGVYLGFNPSPNPGDTVNLLDLDLDVTESVSVLRCKSTLSQTAVDLIVEDQVTLNFTGHVAFPVYVFAEVSYKVGEETSAIIKTSTIAPNGITQIGICKITAADIGGSTLGVPHLQFDPANAPDRHAPIANTGVSFGFMTGGAEQDRQRAVATSDEVDAARVDTVSFTHPSLQDRLTADFSTDRIASAQGRSIEVIRSNDKTGVTGSSINISHSFSFKGRTQEPIIDILGGGVETRNGAVSEVTANIDPATSDTNRNIVNIQDVDSGQPYTDPSTGLSVFGRLVFNEVADGGITLTFVNGNPVVTASGDPTVLVSAGDIIKDPDGNYYPVDSATSGPNIITLSTPWIQATALLTQTLQRRRFTVNFFTRSGGVETTYDVVRSVTLNAATWSGTGLGLSAPGTPEPYSVDGGGTFPGNIVSQGRSGIDTLLYVPTTPANIITAGQTIENAGPTSSVDAVIGTPTADAPDLRFYFNVFQDISESRSNQVSSYLQAPLSLIPRSTENIDGLVRYSSFTGTSLLTALQAADPRVLTQDEKDAASNASAPTAANPFVTGSDTTGFDLISKAGGWARWSKSGSFGAAGPPRTVCLFAFEDSDNHASQGVVATIAPLTGIITLTRPPVGLMYSYTLMFTGSTITNPTVPISFIFSQTASTVPISGTVIADAAGLNYNDGGTIISNVKVDSGVLFPVDFEVQFGAAQSDNSLSKLFILRTARVV